MLCILIVINKTSHWGVRLTSATVLDPWHIALYKMRVVYSEHSSRCFNASRINYHSYIKIKLAHENCIRVYKYNPQLRLKDPC